MTLPWVEKYRPSSFDDVYGQEIAVKIGKAMVDNNLPTNILLCGPPGTGKSTIVAIIARGVLGKYFSTNFLELNASDEVRIDVIRNKIKSFAVQSSFNNVIKIIAMEEVDNVPPDAQQALRVLIESSYKNCKFVLTCNYPSNIIEPIKSRCLIIRLKKISKEDAILILTRVGQEEKLEFSENLIDELNKICVGDMRLAINAIQSCDKKDQLNSIYEMMGVVNPSILKVLVTLISKGRFEKIAVTLNSVLGKASSGHFISQLSNYVIKNVHMDSKTLADFCRIISDYDERLTVAGDQFVQLLGMISKLCVIFRGDKNE